jgi:hypothetical protein
MNTFVTPIMLSRLGRKTLIFFGYMNIIAIPVIWFLYPEVAGRSLEEINLVFTSESLLVSKNMVGYERRVAEIGGFIAIAARRPLDGVDGETHLDPRRVLVGAIAEKGDGGLEEKRTSMEIAHAEKNGASDSE